jgi:small-conductance mechanosensitive channel
MGQVMGYSRYRYTFFRLNPEVRAVADKESEDKSKAVREIERLAKEQSKEEAEASKKKKEAEVKSKKEIEAAEKKAKKEAEKLAKEKAKKEAEEAKRAKKEAERLAKEQAKQAKKAGKEVVQDVSPVTSEGNLQLVLPSSVGFKQLKQFTDHLAGIKDLKIVWTGGSTDEGILITVSVAQAVPLVQILSEMPMVEGVEVKGGKIAITPRASV